MSGGHPAAHACPRYVAALVIDETAFREMRRLTPAQLNGFPDLCDYVAITPNHHDSPVTHLDIESRGPDHDIPSSTGRRVNPETASSQSQKARQQRRTSRLRPTLVLHPREEDTRFGDNIGRLVRDDAHFVTDQPIKPGAITCRLSTPIPRATHYLVAPLARYADGFADARHYQPVFVNDPNHIVSDERPETRRPDHQNPGRVPVRNFRIEVRYAQAPLGFEKLAVKVINAGVSHRLPMVPRERQSAGGPGQIRCHSGSRPGRDGGVPRRANVHRRSTIFRPPPSYRPLTSGGIIRGQSVGWFAKLSAVRRRRYCRTSKHVIPSCFASFLIPEINRRRTDQIALSLTRKPSN